MDAMDATDAGDERDEPRPLIRARDLALMEGVTPDAILKRLERGRIRGHKDEHGQWWVEAPVMSPPEQPNSQALMSREPAEGQLAAMSAYNARLIEPWAAQVEALRRKNEDLLRENGDLKRQVRHYKRALDGVQAALVRALKGDD